MTDLEKAATEMLNCVDGMLAHGEWYAAQEKADNLRAILTWGEPVRAEPVAIPGAIPMAEVAAKSRAMPDRAEALERARERLKQAEPVAEPVAWRYKGEPWFDGDRWHDSYKVTTSERVAKFKDKNAQPLTLVRDKQAEPVVERKPLTKAELQDLLTAIDPENVKRLPHGFYLFARAIEKAHGIGEEE